MEKPITCALCRRELPDPTFNPCAACRFDRPIAPNDRALDGRSVVRWDLWARHQREAREAVRRRYG